MKLFKGFVALLQLAASIYLGYLMYQIIALFIELGGTAIIEQLIFSDVGALCLIDLVLFACAISLLCVNRTSKVKICSTLTIIAVLAYCILVNFAFDLYGLAAVCVLGSFNISLLLGYTSKI